MAHYNGPGNGEDMARDLVLTDAGDIYVTGESLGNGTWADVATVKYGSDGTQLWVARYNYFQHTWDGGAAAYRMDNRPLQATRIDPDVRSLIPGDSRLQIECEKYRPLDFPQFLG